jgi:hypothetical protein
MSLEDDPNLKLIDVADAEQLLNEFKQALDSSVGIVQRRRSRLNELYEKHYGNPYDINPTEFSRKTEFSERTAIAFIIQTTDLAINALNDYRISDYFKAARVIAFSEGKLYGRVTERMKRQKAANHKKLNIKSKERRGVAQKFYLDNKHKYPSKTKVVDVIIEQEIIQGVEWETIYDYLNNV